MLRTNSAGIEECVKRLKKLESESESKLTAAATKELSDEALRQRNDSNRQRINQALVPVEAEVEVLRPIQSVITNRITSAAIRLSVAGVSDYLRSIIR